MPLNLQEINMGFFNKILGSDSSENTGLKLNWIPLTDLGQLNEIVLLSEKKPVLIFKHSTRCSISRMALKQCENEFNLENEIPIYYLDLLEFRPISNEITTRFNTEHQSPQVLLIKNGVVLYKASHSDIDATKLKNEL